MIDHAESVRNFYRKQGAKAEQQRIIELLEAEIARVSNPMLVELDYLDGLNQAIDLIKGESQNDNERVIILAEGETDA